MWEYKWNHGKHRRVQFLQEQKLDVMLLQESDKTTKGRGTVILVQNEIKHQQLLRPSERLQETTGVRLKIIEGELDSALTTGRQTAVKRIEEVLQISTPTIVAGDLNAKHANWNNRTTNARGRKLRKPSNDVTTMKNTKRTLNMEVKRKLSLDYLPVILELNARAIEMETPNQINQL